MLEKWKPPSLPLSLSLSFCPLLSLFSFSVSLSLSLNNHRRSRSEAQTILIPLTSVQPKVLSEKIKFPISPPTFPFVTYLPTFNVPPIYLTIENSS